MPTPSRDRVFDIVVVGAGATGAAAALAFARDGLATCLIGSPETRSDGRTVALLDGSVQFFKALDVWPALEPLAAPMSMMRIIDDSRSLFRPPSVAFRASEIGLECFGWNLENTSLVSALLETGRSSAPLQVRRGSAAALHSDEGVAAVCLSDGSTIRARLAVAADGRQSKLRGASGIRARSWSYPQTALAAIVTHERDHRDTSTEFHTRHGPFTLVPLLGRRSGVVWVTSNPSAQQLAGLDDAAFARAVERQAQSMLGKMRVDSPRGRFPMSGMSVERYHAERLALVGETAHVFPPIGAQGLNLGLRDVAALRDAVVDARADGEDIGGPAALRRYQASRDLDVRLRTAAVDGLNRSLLAGLLPIDFLRGAGLVALSLAGPLRRALMREGVVPSIGAPRLMRTAETDRGPELPWIRTDGRKSTAI